MATFDVADESGDWYEQILRNEAAQARGERDEWHRQNGLLRGELNAARAELVEMQDLLGDIWLYVKWRYVTKQLTTEQKDLWADAVDAWHGRMQAENGEELRPVAERWWRDDFVMDGDD